MQFNNGDYCNEYTAYGPFNAAPTSNGGTYTGITPPTPYSAYQWGDVAGEYCQAFGASTFFGHRVVSTGANDSTYKCFNACGVQRLTSFKNSDFRPWSTAFGNPSLELFYTFRPQTYTKVSGATNNGGWGYICPILQDMSAGAGNPYLEFCVELWQPHTAAASNYTWPPNNNSAIHCQTAADGKAMPLSIAALGVGSNRVTQYDGANTLVATGYGTGWNFHFTISPTNLVNAINKANQTIANGGCFPAPTLSTNPANYRMVSIETGTEIWRTSTSVGTAGGYLGAYTLYGNP